MLIKYPQLLRYVFHKEPIAQCLRESNVGGKTEGKETALMNQKIYIDTSVVAGYFDGEFKEPTKFLFERLVKEQVIFIISDLLELELLQAPEHVKKLLDNFSVNYFESLISTKKLKSWLKLI